MRSLHGQQVGLSSARQRIVFVLVLVGCRQRSVLLREEADPSFEHCVGRTVSMHPACRTRLFRLRERVERAIEPPDLGEELRGGAPGERGDRHQPVVRGPSRANPIAPVAVRSYFAFFIRSGRKAPAVIVASVNGTIALFPSSSTARYTGELPG